MARVIINFNKEATNLYICGSSRCRLQIKDGTLRIRPSSRLKNFIDKGEHLSPISFKYNNDGFVNGAKISISAKKIEEMSKTGFIFEHGKKYVFRGDIYGWYRLVSCYDITKEPSIKISMR